MPADVSRPSRSVLVVGVGAARGLGAAIARRFSKGGYPVVIAGRNAQKLEATVRALEATVRALKEEGGRVEAVVGDATRAEEVRRFVAAAERFAPLGLAIHNAG